MVQTQTNDNRRRLVGCFLKKSLSVALAFTLGLGLALAAPGGFAERFGVSGALGTSGATGVSGTPGATDTAGGFFDADSLFGAGGFFGASQLAFAVTSAEKQAEADEMLRQLDELQTELNKINADYIAAVAAHEDALARMLDAQQREAAAEARIQELQSELSTRAQHMYRQGPGSFLDVIFGAKSFTEFITAMDMMNRVNSRDASLVAESKEMRAEAEAARIEYTEMERVAGEKEAEIATLKSQKETMAAQMKAQAMELATEAEALRIQEELAAEQARLRAEELARKTANGGTPVDPAQLGKVPPLTHPCPGSSGITSPFGYRTFDGIFHQGCDFGASQGTPIYAAAAGTVAYSGWENMSGNVVYLVHGNGVRSVYGHTSQLLCATGEYVEAGQLIALVGTTGYSTGPHLHFQIEIDGVAVDPQIFL
jgi:murein DD-endopeptidase MepM/ murein hydrolase activator NlpD